MRDRLRRELIAQKVLEHEVGAKVTVSDQQVTDFFNANRAQFNLPEDALHLAQIIVTPVRDQQIANRTGDDATTPQAAAMKVKMLMDRLQSGTPFGDLARDFSEDPESAPRGGDLGLVPMSAINQAAPALRDTVLKLEPGRARLVSGGGAHTIIFVVSREPAGQRDLSTPNVKERITATLKGRREQLLRTAFLTTARTDADVVNYLARRVVEEQSKNAPARAGSGDLKVKKRATTFRGLKVNRSRPAARGVHLPRHDYELVSTHLSHTHHGRAALRSFTRRGTRRRPLHSVHRLELRRRRRRRVQRCG